MEIVWLGHSCFRIRGRANARSSGRETAIVTDPCSPTSGYTIGRPTAAIATISHNHTDHSYLKGVAGSPQVITGPGEYEINGVFLTGIPTYHDSQNGVELGKNIVFVIELENITICHLGDLGHIPTAGQVEALTGIDILLVPIGGNTTINGPRAAEVVSLLEPRLVIPMHYRTSSSTADLEPLDSFLKEMGGKTPEAQAKFSISHSSLPDETQIVTLDYKR